MNDFTLSGPAWFDALTEPVVMVRDGAVDYCNAAAAAKGLATSAPAPELLADTAEGVSTLEWQGESWVCRCARVDGAKLLQLSRVSEGSISMDRLSQLASKLRRPLGNLIGALQLLEREDLDEAKREQFNAIGKKSYYVMLRMVENMELIGGLESAAYHPEPLDFGGLCAHVVRQVEYLAEQAERTIVLQPWEGNLVVMGESPWLRKLLYQLINNALRAAGIGGCVTLRLEKRGQNVRLVISDTGGGYSTAELTRAFDPEQADQSMNNPGAGMGLGISICRAIVERHGGRVFLLSGNGGTTVVELPLAQRKGHETADGEDPACPSDFTGGLSEPITQLSDLLPWQCFTEDF